MFYGASNVLSNAYLPVFVRNHPDMCPPPPAIASSAASTSASESTETTPLFPTPNPLEEEAEKANRIAAHISSRGLTFGYISALIMQATALGTIVFVGAEKPISLKLPIFLASTWWGLFMFPTVPFWLKPRPGPPLSAAQGGLLRRTMRYIGFGWVQIWETIKEVGRLREVRIYLLSWFLLSDGVITMSALAIIYAKTSLELTPSGLALISATALIMNALGAWLWPSYISQKLRLQVVPTMKLLITLMACLPGYAILGIVWPGIVDTLGFGALTNPWELYSLAALFGFLAGGVNVYGRAIYSELIPSGKESKFFSVPPVSYHLTQLYAITDKGSSAIGPALTGLIISLTGNIRLAFMLVVILFVGAIFVLRHLDLTRGKIEAEEVGPLSPVTLEDSADDELTRGEPDLGGKEDSD
jgi:MFS transporter, UMF1 family